MITRLNRPDEEPLISLPSRTDYIVNVNLTADERVLYEHMKDKTTHFVKILRMRQGRVWIRLCEALEISHID